MITRGIPFLGNHHLWKPQPIPYLHPKKKKKKTTAARRLHVSVNDAPRVDVAKAQQDLRQDTPHLRVGKKGDLLGGWALWKI